ncbi:unnamed protein product [Bursaphelenchus okinawaensis]|uniref:Tubulin--tyrosine ligase-like protein 12 SET-like domain-containing protein n=1 Tax=Bursaphelenchus okinawaensis TaxID=465554 RepID=A0A811K551_9BILA|nr:unnamed protein product [Bursaphelenchus okinawaensis]CAG9092703.1 unnamed protein product [Bursaphelenchus okinawaensis]
MTDYTYEQFVEVHEPQLRTSAVPELFWPSLFEKLKNEDFDAGKFFQIIVEENETDGNNYSVIALEDIKADDGKSIFLIDHCFTFRLNNARDILKQVPGFKERLIESMGISVDDLEDLNSCSDYIGSESGDAHPTGEGKKDVTSEEKEKNEQVEEKMIDAIMDNIWKFAQTYTVRRSQNVLEESDMPIWYLPDEFGMRVGHSKDPNVRIVPFFYGFTGQAFSVMFPTQDIKDQEEVTRNYVDNAILKTHPEWYNVLLYPWEAVDLSESDLKKSVKGDEFFTSGRHPDHVPEGSQHGAADDNAGIMDTVRIVATDTQLIERLQGIQYGLVDDVKEADVLWLREHFHEFKGLFEQNPKILVNQFPYESNLTVKDLFAASIETNPDYEKSFNEETLEYGPEWFQTTFNLNEELPTFVAHYQKRAKKNLDNTWIVKPWNLARGLDTVVTDNLDCIIRMVETGPKLVSKYIEDPVLVKRKDNGNLVKFDLRFIVFVRSLEPLELCLYNDFWPRLAVNEYDLSDLSDNFTHLSVHNYTDKTKVVNVTSDEFIKDLIELNPQIKWEQVKFQIDSVIKQVFETVTKNKPPRGVAPNLQSRAMYGFDLMLKWKNREHKDVSVTFLEANFMPDCQRATEFYPDFADTVFQTLFLGGGSNRVHSI